jgi:hypothetical protein
MFALRIADVVRAEGFVAATALSVRPVDIGEGEEPSDEAGDGFVRMIVSRRARIRSLGAKYFDEVVRYREEETLHLDVAIAGYSRRV